MSEISHRNINAHTQKVSELKNRFMNEYKNNAKAIDIIREARIIHGCAIVDNYNDIKSVSEKGDKAQDEDYIKLSSNASLLHVIHAHIRQCEQQLYKNTKKENMAATLLTSDSELKSMTNPANETSFANAISKNRIATINKNKVLTTNLNNESNLRAIIRQKIDSANTDELSISFPTENIDTELKTSDILTEIKPPVKTNLNTSDYINNIDTDEVTRLEADYVKQPTNFFDKIKSIFTGPPTNPAVQQGGNDNMTDDKPTIVNFYADWCGFSKDFQKPWNEFKTQSKNHFPNLQVIEIDVGNDRALDEMAKKAGVEGYPTIVIFNGPNKTKKVASKMNAEDIKNFVKQNL